MCSLVRLRAHTRNRTDARSLALAQARWQRIRVQRTRARTRERAHARMYACAHLHTLARSHACAHARTPAPTHARAHMRIHAARSHAHMHARRHTRTHTWSLAAERLDNSTVLVLATPQCTQADLVTQSKPRVTQQHLRLLKSASSLVQQSIP